MTISLVAIETDVVRDGRPVVGYGFSSNGRYAQGGILRERFIPRIMQCWPLTRISSLGKSRPTTPRLVVLCLDVLGQFP